MLLSGQISLDEFSQLETTLLNYPTNWPWAQRGNLPIELSSFSVERQRLGDIVAFFDQGTALGPTLFTGLVEQATGSGTQVGESGVTDSYTLCLRNRPDADVTVTLTANSQIRLGLSPTDLRDTVTLTITPDQWRTSQIVYVAAVDDDIPEGEHAGSISYTINSSDANYDQRNAGPTTVQILDNDLPPHLIVTMARGAGQSVNIPNTATGRPIRIDNAGDVTSLAVDLMYDPNLLNITAAALAAGLPGDWSVTLDASTPGVAKINASGTTPLSGSNVDVVRLAAAVPSTAPYGAVQTIRLENVALNGGTIPAIGDVAVHKAAYLGDADSSGLHSSADAFLTVQAALGLASGFAAHAWTDPRIVGDADGSGVLSAADAFLIVQEGLGLSEPFVPDNPHISVTPVGGGVDPQFRIDVNIPASAGGLLTVPVKLDVEPAATNVARTISTCSSIRRG